MYFSTAWGERSRPKPDCLKPPKGVAIDDLSKALIQTVPALIAEAADAPRSCRSVQTAAASP